MNLYSKLKARADKGNPVRVGLIGAGKFGTMFLSQARHTVGMHVVAVADLSGDRAHAALRRAGWPDEAVGARAIEDAVARGGTHVTEDAGALIAAEGVEVVVEATGDPVVGIAHALGCFEAKRHVVMVNVEADVVAGPLLARKAREAGVVYSMAYGDQPALICEMVDWARACGLRVVCAGKGTKYMPHYHQSTPDTVWDHYGMTARQAEAGGMQAKMFNSFLDGTKSAIEMAAVCNASGLLPQARAGVSGALGFPACGMDDLPIVLRPRARGGQLDGDGTVEVVSSLERDGRPVHRDLRWGVYVAFEAPNSYSQRCLGEYGVVTDPDDGRYAALYRPFHLIGLELGVSVANIAVREEATGAPTGFRADVAATSKRDLRAGETLDGEGGYMVYGALTPAQTALGADLLPIGLATGLILDRDIRAGEPVRWSDVKTEGLSDGVSKAIKVRREMEKLFAKDLAVADVA